MLEENAKEKAEQMLEGIVENKKRADANALEVQRQV